LAFKGTFATLISLFLKDNQNLNWQNFGNFVSHNHIKPVAMTQTLLGLKTSVSARGTVGSNTTSSV